MYCCENAVATLAAGSQGTRPPAPCLLTQKEEAEVPHVCLPTKNHHNDVCFVRVSSGNILLGDVTTVLDYRIILSVKIYLTEFFLKVSFKI